VISKNWHFSIVCSPLLILSKREYYAQQDIKRRLCCKQSSCTLLAHRHAPAADSYRKRVEGTSIRDSPIVRISVPVDISDQRTRRQCGSIVQIIVPVDIMDQRTRRYYGSAYPSILRISVSVDITDQRTRRYCRLQVNITDQCTRRYHAYRR
jgi:hypothetical protein